MANSKKIKDYLNQKKVPSSLYYEAHLENALFDEKHMFFELVKQSKQYQEDYDYNLIKYKSMKLLEKYEGVERTSKELRMVDQIKFMQAQLPIFTNNLSKEKFYSVMKTFDKEYENKFEQLKAAKKTFKEVLFLSAKEGLTETKENALISALANIDVDTTKDNLDEHELYNPQNEKNM